MPQQEAEAVEGPALPAMLPVEDAADAHGHARPDLARRPARASMLLWLAWLPSVSANGVCVRRSAESCFGSYVELRDKTVGSLFDGIDVKCSDKCMMQVIDVDKDGDWDLVLGTEYGRLRYFENNRGLQERIGVENPFDEIFVHDPFKGKSHVFMHVVDWNGDGFLDIIMGSHSSTHYFEHNGNSAPATPASAPPPAYYTSHQYDNTDTTCDGSGTAWGKFGLALSLSRLDVCQDWCLATDDCKFIQFEPTRPKCHLYKDCSTSRSCSAGCGRTMQKQVHFDPTSSFETDANFGCPSGWTCTGAARVCSSSCGYTPGNMHGSRYFSVGDGRSTGRGTSPAFVLPPEVDRIRFLRAGGADAPSGLTVRSASNGAELCAAQNGEDTITFFDDYCTNLTAYAGQSVYIVVEATVRGAWGKVWIDRIQMEDSAGNPLPFSQATEPTPTPAANGAVFAPAVTPLENATTFTPPPTPAANETMLAQTPAVNDTTGPVANDTVYALAEVPAVNGTVYTPAPTPAANDTFFTPAPTQATNDTAFTLAPTPAANGTNSMLAPSRAGNDTVVALAPTPAANETAFTPTATPTANDTNSTLAPSRAGNDTVVALAPTPAANETAFTLAATPAANDTNSTLAPTQARNDTVIALAPTLVANDTNSTANDTNSAANDTNSTANDTNSTANDTISIANDTNSTANDTNSTADDSSLMPAENAEANVIPLTPAPTPGTVFTDRTGQFVRMRRERGYWDTPSFSSCWTTATGDCNLPVGFDQHPQAVDLDSDGDLDYVVGADSVHWFENKDGELVHHNLKQYFDAGWSPVPGDFDGDGDIDILVLTKGDYRIRYLEHSADGGFQERVGAAHNPFESLGGGIQAAQLVDVNGDGLRDLVAMVALSLNCTAHAHCGAGAFCHAGACAACDTCRQCSDGIDGTCGSCGITFPTSGGGCDVTAWTFVGDGHCVSDTAFQTDPPDGFIEFSGASFMTANTLCSAVPVTLAACKQACAEFVECRYISWKADAQEIGSVAWCTLARSCNPSVVHNNGHGVLYDSYARQVEPGVIIPSTLIVKAVANQFRSVGTFTPTVIDISGLVNRSTGKLTASMLKFDLLCTEHDNCLEAFGYCNVSNESGIVMPVPVPAGGWQIDQWQPIAVTIIDGYYEDLEDIPWNMMTCVELYSQKAATNVSFALRNIRFEADAWDPANCPHARHNPDVCWAASAYQACPFSRQEAYDEVMVRRGDLQAMHAKYTELIVQRLGCTEAYVLRYYEQVVDDSLRPVEGQSEPVAGLIGRVPSAVDWDMDGDLDLFMGGQLWPDDTLVQYYEHMDDGSFKQLVATANPLYDIVHKSHASQFGETNIWPSIVDWNGDGLLDVLHGTRDGLVQYYQQRPGGSFQHMQGIDNPFSMVNVSCRSGPQAVDWDSDGDLDLIVGGWLDDHDGECGHIVQAQTPHPGFAYFENENGTLTAGNYSLFSQLPPYTGLSPSAQVHWRNGLAERKVFPKSFHAVDWDLDGDIDLVVALIGPDVFNGDILYFERQPDGSLKDHRTSWTGDFHKVGSGPFARITSGGLAQGHIHLMDLHGQGQMSLLIAHRDGEPTLYTRGCVLDNEAGCSSRGACGKNFKCRCVTGHELGDCSGCSRGFWHSQPRTVARRAPGCRACPAVGVHGEAGFPRTECMARGTCSDGPAARAARSSQAMGAGTCGCNDACCRRTFDTACYKGECGVGWAEGLEHKGVPGVCTCSGPFSGRDCGHGQCYPGSELRQYNGSDLDRCQPCFPGYAKQSAGNGPAVAGEPACAACAAGHYAGTSGQTECTPCQAGWHQPLEAQQSCVLCPEGAYSGAAAIACSACPAGTTSSQDRTRCLCPRGAYFLDIDRFPGCEACPAGQSTLSTGAISSQECIHPDQASTITHVSGRDLLVTLTGSRLQARHKLGIMAECGNGTLQVMSSSLDGTDYAFNRAMLPGGVYRLCWCSNLEPIRCNTVANFGVDVGALRVVGPLGIDNYACVKSRACSLALIQGTDLAATDLLVLKTDCRFAFYPPGLEALPSVNLSLSGNGFLAHFDQLLDAGEPGQMAVCWCRPPCSGLESFASTVGTLVLQGPRKGHSVACYIGQPCTLRGIRGVGLQRGDRLAVLGACGLGVPRVRGFPGELAPEAAPPSANGDTTLLEATGGEALSARAGIYRLCFCRPTSEDSCTEADSFVADIGLFIAQGPYTDNEASCVLGHICNISGLRGLGLVNGDEAVLRHECDGDAGVLGGVVAQASSGGSFFSFGELALDGPPGSYRLCWRPVGHAVGNFSVDAGQVTILCPPGYFAVSGQVRNRCAMCSEGYFCTGREPKQQCPSRSTTNATGRSSLQECLCDAGHYLERSSQNCVACPTARYKPDVSNDEMCEGQCPQNATSLPGSSHKSQCFCNEGLVDTDDDPEQAACAPTGAGLATAAAARAALARQATTTVHVVQGQLTLSLSTAVLPEDVPRFQEVVVRALAESLGVLVSAVQLDWGAAVALSARRLAEATTTVSYTVFRASPSVAQSIASRMNVEEVATSLGAWRSMVGNASVQVQDVWESQAAVVTVHQLDCAEAGRGKAFPLGSRPVSVTECQCTAGFEPEDYESLARPRCHECPIGYFKVSIADTACQRCGRGPSGVQLYTLSVGATSSESCTCPPGYYHASNASSCMECGIGHYCPGDTERVKCPLGSTTLTTRANGIGDCFCDAGFRPAFQRTAASWCVPCPVGLYKVSLGDMDCTSRCRPGSSSSPGAKIGMDCYCLETYYYRNATGTCEACLSEGVRCPGMFDPMGSRTHSEPLSIVGFYMTGFASAERCEIEDEAGLPVCLAGATEKNQSEACSAGHTGLMCGACRYLHARDLWDQPCAPCDLQTYPEWVLISILNLDLLLKAGFGLFLGKLAVDSIAKTNRADAIVLRILLQWITASSVIGLFDFSDLQVFGWSRVPPHAAAAGDEETAVIGSAGAVGLNFKFDFPAWFPSAWGALMSIRGSIPSISSPHQAIECLVQQRWQADSEGLSLRQLLAPAVWWLAYPVLVLLYEAVLALLLAKLVYPVMICCTRRARRKLERLLLAAGCSGVTAAAAAEALDQNTVADILDDPEERLSTVKGLMETFGMDVMAEVVTRSLLESPSGRLSEMLEGLADSGTLSEPSQDTLEAVLDRGVDGSAPFIAEVIKNVDPESLSGILENPLEISQMIVDSIQQADGEGIHLAASFGGADTSGAWHDKYVVFGLFRSTRLCHVLVDAAPLYMVTLYSVWDVVTRRMLGLVQMRSVAMSVSEAEYGMELQELQVRWRYDMRLQGFTGNHYYVGMVGVAGLSLWSIGFLVLVYLRLYRSSNNLQDPPILRSFGYFYNGLALDTFWWEILAKKLDMLLLYGVTFTELVADPRAKLIAYLGLTGVFLAAHKRCRPFDARRNGLADRLEGEGLAIRFLTIFVLQVLLMLNASHRVNFGFAVFLVTINGWFILKSVLIMIIEMAGRNDRCSRSPQDQGAEATRAAVPTGACTRALGILLGIGRKFGGKKEALLRAVPHIKWQGPGHDLLVVTFEPNGQPRCLIRPFNWMVSSLYRLGDQDQRKFVGSVVGAFVCHILTNLEFHKVPGNLLDLLFLLPQAIHRERSHDRVGAVLDAPFFLRVARRVRRAYLSKAKSPTLRDADDAHLRSRLVLASYSPHEPTANGEDLHSALLFIQGLRVAEAKKFFEEACYESSESGVAHSSAMESASEHTLAVTQQVQSSNPRLAGREVSSIQEL